MSKQDIEKRLGFAAQGVKETTRPGAKATFAEFNVGDKVVATPNNHIDAYGRIIKIENGIATIASAEGNVKAKLSDLELVKKGSVEDLRRLGMKGFARPGAKAEFYASPEHIPLILAQTRKMHADSKKAAEKYLKAGSVGNIGGAAGLASSMVNALERDLKEDLYRLTQSRNPVHKKAAKEAYAEIKAMADWWYSQYKKWTAARPGVKAKFGRFDTDFSSLAKQIPSQPDLAKKSIIALAKKMGKEVDITRAEFEQLMQYAAKLGMETQVANAHDDVRPGFSRTGAKGKFVRIVTTPQGRYTTNLDKNTRAPIEGGKGYVMVDPAQYITPKRVRVQGTKGEIEVRAVLDGKEIVGVSAKLVSSRPGVKAKMAKRMVVDTITSGNQKHELGYESVMQSLTAGEPPHEWFRPVVRTTNLDTGKSSEKASQPHYTEKSARDWLKNYASSVKPSTDPLYAEYASNREKISKMMTRLAQARNNPEMRQKLQAESDKLDARQREVAAQLQKRKSSRPNVKAKA
jgi:hypothetical protein